MNAGLGICHRMLPDGASGDIGSGGGSQPLLAGTELVDDSGVDGELIDDNLTDFARVED